MEATAKKRNLLLVEDHPDTTDAVKRLLTKEGYFVLTAKDVKSALDISNSIKVDLVIADIGLPDGTGYDLMKQLASKYGMKGIALTGRTDPEYKQWATEAGFSDFVEKPYDFEKLKTAIKNAIAN